MSQVFPKEDRQALRRAIKLLDYDRAKFWWSVAAGTGAIGSGVGLGATSAWLIARAAQLPSVLELTVAATGVRAFGIGKAIFRYLERIASHWVALYGMANLRASVYHSLAHSPADVVTSIKRGDLLSRTGADVDEVGQVVVRSMLPAAVAFWVCLISVLIVGLLSPLIGLVLALCLAVSAVVGPYFAMRGARMAEHAQVKNRARLSATALTLLESAAQLRVAGRLTDMEQAQQDIETEIHHNRNAAAKPTAVATALDTLMLGVAVVAALVIGIAQVSAGTLNGIELVVCVLTPLSAFEATQRLSGAAVQLVRSGSAARRIMEILDRAAAAELPPHDSHTPDNSGLIARDLVIGWPGGPAVAGPLNLSVKPGQNLAIVGPSGIGKTTLLLTLSGMLEPHSGSVQLNGREVSHLAREEVSQDLTVTAEDAHIFETSVLENLRVARPDLTPEQATALLTEAGLGDWLSQLPEAVDTMLGTDATTISGGERRRLLLARALAAPAQFMLLDEPAEHLDAETADTLLRDLLRAGGEDRAVILVTHRLAPLDAADEVVMIDLPANSAQLPNRNSPAQIIARGTHAELLAKMPTYQWSAGRE
ncbi:MAG: thiol reductant ABC exporter subunit CydC [Trueperella sp.]|nr:thiol reductant ABC exporter subunit CydC [Trueperella sp.]